MVNSRAKGKSGELEVVHMIRDNLGIKCNRQYKQNAEAGHGDIEQLIGPYLIECKNHSTQSGMKAWWQQVVTAAAAHKDNPVPCLAYKVLRKGWRFVVPIPDAWDTGYQWAREIQYTMTLHPDGFYLMVRRYCERE